MFPMQDFRIEHRLQDLRLSRYWNGRAHFPALKGKAAELRHFAVPLHAVCLQFLDQSVEEHRLMTTLALLATKIETLLDTHADVFRMPATAATELQNYIRGFVQTTSALAHHFHPRHVVLFNFTIKCHYAIHLAILAPCLNVRMAWCYAGEDLMQKVKGIAKTCHPGTKVWQVPNKVMQKYTLGLGMAFQGSEMR